MQGLARDQARRAGEGPLCCGQRVRFRPGPHDEKLYTGTLTYLEGRWTVYRDDGELSTYSPDWLPLEVPV